MDFAIKNKVAIVGGASGGIGSAICHALAREGVRLLMWSRRDPALSEAAEKVRQQTGAEIMTVLGDVRRPEDHEKIVQTAIERFGGVDILVHNDGAPPLGMLSNFDDETWDKAIRQMLTSAIRLSRLCIPLMREKRWGRIVNVAALSAKAPIAGFGLSVTTLAGLIGYAKTLSREVGPDGITINTICPGRIDTELTKRAFKAQSELQKRPVEALREEATLRIPVRRFGRPEEIGALVAFLASEQAAFITGTAVQIDGGSLESLM